MSGIACILNAENIPTKSGSIWNSGTVRAVLSNCNNAGYVRYSTENPERFFEADGKHKAIITEEEFTAAKILMEKNKGVSPTRKPVDENYFAGLLYCGVCGRKFVTQTTVKHRKGEKQTQNGFKCLGGMVNACKAKQLTVPKLEKALLAYFANIPEIEPDTEKDEQAKRETAARIEALQNKINSLDGKEKEVLDLYIEDNATLAEYRSVKEKLDVERVNILAEIQRITPTEPKAYKGIMTQEEIALTFCKEWQSYTSKEKRQFLVNHINKIVVINQPLPGTIQGKYEIVDVAYNTNT